MTGMLTSKRVIKRIRRKSNILICLIISIFLSINVTSACFTSLSTLKNKFNTLKYSFSLNGNGGSFTSKSVIVKGDVTTLPIPTRYGYNFVGFGTSENGSVITSNKVENMDLINDKTIYAVWSPTSYKINYILDGGTIKNAKTTYNITEEFTLVKPTKVGYDFIGWTGPRVTTPTINVLVSKGSSGTRNYTAHWEKIDAAITGITIVSYRSTDYGENYETWYGNADGYYKVGTSNENTGNWNVTVSSNTVKIVGTTNVTSKNRYYRFYIYAGDGTTTLLGVAEDHPVEYRGSGTKAQITYSW